MIGRLRSTYLTIAPQTLALLRVALSALLLVDLARRAQVLSVFFTNAGLFPNHRLLWSAPREYAFSFLLALSSELEVSAAFVVIAIVYLCLLIGWRTRLMQVLAWLSFVSLTVRVEPLVFGADLVLSQLLLWTAFLPLGRCCSIDALSDSLRREPERSFAELEARAAAREPAPVVSWAVLAACLQLSVVYYFNTVHKTGSTWRNGSAVYYLVHQERIVTQLGLWLREHAPFWMFRGMSYSTLALEGVLPLLILSPWGQPWTRRSAIALIFALHTGIAALANVGLFSFVMITFSLLLLDAGVWHSLRERAQRRPRLQVYLDEECGLSWQLARLLRRLDAYARLQFHALAELAPQARASVADASWVLLSAQPAQAPVVCERAFSASVRAVPGGWLLRWLVRPLDALLAGRGAERRKAWSAWLGLAPASSPRPAAVGGEPAPFRRTLRGWRAGLREACVLGLIATATSQVLAENRAVPRSLRQRDQPALVRAIVGYARLSQRWSMFAPNAPTHDYWVVIDAETADGRHVDPLNALASRVADPLRRDIPPRLGQSAFFCNYQVRIANDEVHHDALREWIMAHHTRTGRPNDRVVGFSAYLVEQDSPAPGETAPRNVSARIFLQ